MENRAEFRLGKRIFLGILGNLGSKIDPRDLSKKTRASGLNGHGNRGKIVRERREMSNFSRNPRILFIGVWEASVRGAYARTQRVRVRHAWASPRLPRLRMGRIGSDGTGRTGESVASHRGDVDEPRPRPSGTRGVRGYAARNSDEDADSSFGYYRIFELNIYKLFSKVQKIISSSYELRFRWSLYPRVGETTLYNFRLDAVGKFRNYFYYLFIKMTWLRNFFKNS